MLPCPTCKRRIYTRRDLVCAPLEGKVRCRFCGRSAHLDLLSRWLIMSIIALTLPALFLSWGIFYSGHLFVLSIVTVLAGWAGLAALLYPLLRLEALEGRVMDRAQGLMTLAVLLIVALLLDGHMASRFSAEEALDDKGPASGHRTS